eukprot:844599-Prorocentrum_minimum.AAC.2
MIHVVIKLTRVVVEVAAGGRSSQLPSSSGLVPCRPPLPIGPLLLLVAVGTRGVTIRARDLYSRGRGRHLGC